MIDEINDPNIKVTLSDKTEIGCIGLKLYHLPYVSMHVLSAIDLRDKLDKTLKLWVETNEETVSSFPPEILNRLLRNIK